jgi:hypothetical protein
MKAMHEARGCSTSGNSMSMKNFAGAVLKAAIAVFLNAATVSFGAQVCRDH